MAITLVNNPHWLKKGGGDRGGVPGADPELSQGGFFSLIFPGTCPLFVPCAKEGSFANKRHTMKEERSLE